MPSNRYSFMFTEQSWSDRVHHGYIMKGSKRVHLEIYQLYKLWDHQRFTLKTHRVVVCLLSMFTLPLLAWLCVCVHICCKYLFETIYCKTLSDYQNFGNSLKTGKFLIGTEYYFVHERFYFFFHYIKRYPLYFASSKKYVSCPSFLF